MSKNKKLDSELNKVAGGENLSGNPFYGQSFDPLYNNQVNPYYNNFFS